MTAHTIIDADGDLLGDHLVLFASDYPHFDCAFPRSTDGIAAHVSDPTRLAKITVDNPRRLYGARLPIG